MPLPHRNLDGAGLCDHDTEIVAAARVSVRVRTHLCGVLRARAVILICSEHLAARSQFANYFGVRQG
jgi:hypothetical protein